MKNLLLFLTVLSVNFFYPQETTIQDSTLTSTEVAFDIIEKVPVFPGCDKNMGNQALKECLNERLINHVKKNFNFNIGRNLNIENGVYQIQVFFRIHKSGYIIDVKTQSEIHEANIEAKRVISLLPKFEPGYIDGEPVTVPYYLPIKFNIDNKQNSKKTVLNRTFPVHKKCNENLDYNSLKACTKEKIANYIKVSVNYELADKLFPQDKSTQFQVKFTINKKGKLENISAQAHKREMAAEAIRVLKRMPKLKKPGFENSKPVDVDMQFLMTIYF